MLKCHNFNTYEHDRYHGVEYIKCFMTSKHVRFVGYEHVRRFCCQMHFVMFCIELYILTLFILCIFNPYKPSVLYVVHKQTAQNQI